MENWRLLNEKENKRIWDKIFTDLRFNPLFEKTAKSFNIEQNHIIFDISHIWGSKDFEPLYIDLEDRMIEIFKSITNVDEEVYALDWQHECYEFNPRGDMPRNEFGEWLVPILPDGDYYFFIQKNFEWGYLGHPWEKTITIFGDKLIEGVKLNKPIILRQIKKEVMNKVKIYSRANAPIELDNNKLKGANLDGLNLHRAVLSDEDLEYASLIKSELRSAELEKANLSNCNMTKANLMNAWMNNAILKNTILHDSLIGADMSGANLENADLTGARLFSANLTNANLKGTKLSCKEIENSIFTGAFYNSSTVFPDFFNPSKHGMIKVK